MNRGACIAIGAVLLLASCSAKSGDDRLDPLGIIPPPPSITPAEASEHVGELVVVRARIAEASVANGQALLEPEGAAEGGLTIAIAPPIVGPTARELAAKYDGQDVRAVGTISDLGGDLELLIGDPGRIRLADEGSTADRADVEASQPEEMASALAAEPAAPPAPVAAAPVPAPVPAPSTPAVPAATTAAATAGAVATTETNAEAEAACTRARQSWRRAAADAKGPLRELLSCLDEGEPRCRDAAARARIALSEVAASEERVRWVCGGGS